MGIDCCYVVARSVIKCGKIESDLVWFSLVYSGLVGSGFLWSGLVWFSLVYYVWSGIRLNKAVLEYNGKSHR